MKISEEIENTIKKAIKDQYGLEREVKIEKPQDESHGDFASNIAMTLTKKLKKNPREIADGIISHNEIKSNELFERIEVAGPGFINFTLSDDFLKPELLDFFENSETRLVSELLKDKNVVVEYTDPNPFKIFHIGHLYSNAVGESISRLYEVNGANVHRANFYGDVGLHVAKAIWGIIHYFESEQWSIEKLKDLSLPERVEFMGKAYAKGATEFKEGPESAENEIKQINSIIYVVAQEIWKDEGINPVVDYEKFLKIGRFDRNQIKDIYKIGRQWSLDYFETIYEILGTKFDGYYPESRAGEKGYELVKEGLEKGIFEKSEGAIVFPGKKHGLHTRVFINSLGLPTYESKDFGLAPWKYEDFKYDKSIIVTANEIDAYFKVVIKAMKELQPELGNKTFHISHGMVKLPEGKMSSRTGKILAGKWLIDEAAKKAKEKIENSDRDKLEETEVDEVSQKVALAGIKYSLLKSTVGKDISFDFDKSISFEGDSGPYIQYTYSRCKSILRSESTVNIELGDLNEEERNILRHIINYQDVLEIAARDFAPNILTNFLHELAQKFNTFYNKHRILDDIENKNQRLIITQVVAKILAKGLYILGIPVMEKM